MPVIENKRGYSDANLFVCEVPFFCKDLFKQERMFDYFFFGIDIFV